MAAFADIETTTRFLAMIPVFIGVTGFIRFILSDGNIDGKISLISKNQSRI